MAYFKEHLVTENYYTGKGKFPGIFVGEGWNRLIQQPEARSRGIPESVSEEFFLALCDGLDPFTGKKLYLRRKAAGERRIFFDFTCSAFKSASLLDAGMKTEGIRKIHEEAAKEAITAMEAYAAGRLRKGGQDEDRLTGNFIAAAFTHTTSRANDPQLHTHFLIFNTTYDRVDKCWKALQPGLLYEASRYATLVYQNAFIGRMHKKGFEFVRRGKHFEIKGVSDQMIEDYSKRAKERDKLIEQKAKEDGVSFLTTKQISQLLHQNRPRKSDKENKLKPKEVAALKELCGMAHRRRSLKRKPPPAPPGTLETLGMSHAVEHAFERKSVISEFELLESALRRGLEEAVALGEGSVNVKELQNMANQDDFIRKGLEVTRQEIIDQEVRMMEMVKVGRNNCQPIAPHFLPGDILDEEQRNVVLNLLSTKDRITGFRGLAGTGKTRTLQELQRACSSTTSPTKILFCAPSSSAVQTLIEDEIVNPVTLQELLLNKSLQASMKGGVIVLDEAGLVGSGNMHDLFDLAITQDARVILSGDTSQHKSVPRGDALRILETYSDYRYLQIQTIRRQRELFYRSAVQEAATRDPQKALDILDHKDWILESKYYQQEAAEAYTEILKAEQNAKSGAAGTNEAEIEKPAPVIMTAPTWKEIDGVTEKVRACLHRDGFLKGDDTMVDTFRSKSWTQAEKRCVLQYKALDRISFQKPMDGFKTHELVTVVEAIDDPRSPRTRLLLKVCRADGSTRLFDPRSGSGFDVGILEKRPFCSGDTILFQANRKQRQKRPKTGEKEAFHHFVNGTTAKIARIVNGQIILSDGRVLPKDFQHFTHGYCLTSHTAQGKTAETVIVVANASSRTVNREQFYVSISRGRAECRVFTNDKEHLRQRIIGTSERKAGIELIQAQCVAQSRAILKQRRMTRSAARPAALSVTPQPSEPASSPEEPIHDIDL